MSKLICRRYLVDEVTSSLVFIMRSLSMRVHVFHLALMRRFRFRNASFLYIDAVFYVVYMLDMMSKLCS